MFLLTQFPMADSRPFVTGATRKLPRPRFGLPQQDPQFFRGFGALTPRRKGLPPDWPFEDVFCHAARGLRIPPDALTPLAVPSWGPHFAVKLRRLLADGRAVARIELGLNRLPDRAGSGPLTPGRLDQLLTALAALRIKVHTRLGDVERPLAGSGAPLAAHYLANSTQWKDAPADFATESWWVRGGMPLVIMAYRPHELEALPTGAEPVEVLSGVQLHHLERTDLGLPCIWLLGAPRTAEGLPLRALRLHLGRLHTERETLRMVLANIADHDLALSSRPNDPLAIYLEQADGFLRRETVYGHRQSDLLRTAYGADELINGAQMGTLRTVLAETRGTLLARLEETVQAPKDRFPL